MQRLKTHPIIKEVLEGGKRISYGARALAKGGLNSLPKLTFPGGVLIGDDAGFLNPAKIKGTHTSMKSGCLPLKLFLPPCKRVVNTTKSLPMLKVTKIHGCIKTIYEARNFSPAIHKYGLYFGGAFTFVEHNLLGGKMPFTLHDTTPDFAQLEAAKNAFQPTYPKPDGKLTFDKLSSVFISNTNHAEDQPCHLRLTDPTVPIEVNLPKYAEPARLYCPAGVYEVVTKDDDVTFVINAQNCVHCKTCDIKDPSQNITWVTPEGGGGPNYPNM